MPFSGNTYTQISVARDEIEDIINANMNALDNAVNTINQVITNMNSAASEYGTIVGAAQTLLASSPSDPAFISLNASVQRHLEDFNSTMSRAQTLSGLLNPP